MSSIIVCQVKYVENKFKFDRLGGEKNVWSKTLMFYI